MKNTIIKVMTFLSIAAGNTFVMAADFSCEQIKDKQIRGQCIAARNEKVNNTRETALAQENEKKIADARGKETEKALILAKEALKALKKLSIRVNTGISYRDYPAALSDAKFETQQFTESQQAKNLPQVASSMSLALKHYETAHELWKYKFEDSGMTNTVSSVTEEAKFDGFLSAHYYFNINQQKRKFIDELAVTYKGT